MKNQFINFALVFILLSLAPKLSAQCYKKDSVFLYNIITFLSSDSLQGREGGSEYEKATASFIASQLKTNKLKPFFGESYFQEFDFLYDSINFHSQNVGAWIDNKADSTIIIISHYDHIGHGGSLSKSFVSNKIHPGADDNASGVSANLLILKKLKEKNSEKYNYIFLFTGAHEKGLHGSKYFSKYLFMSDYKIKLTINLDMIGRLDISIQTLIFETNLPNLTSKILSDYSNNELVFQEREVQIGDHTIFKEYIPILFITSGIHKDYHKTSDSADKINYLGLYKITKLIIELNSNI